MMNIALIVAAGSGTRMKNQKEPKQFICIEDKPLLLYSLQTFNSNDNINAIVLVTNQDYLERVNFLCQDYHINKLIKVVAGGSTRQESVFLGLSAIKEIAQDDDIVLIHDAARPLVDAQIINENISMCQKHQAVTTAMQNIDTVISSIDGETIDKPLNRHEIMFVQTPQTFKFALISEAHEKAKAGQIPNVTDDTKLVISMGKDVHLVEGSKQNFKITTFDDLMMLKALLKIGKTEVL